MTAEEFIKDAQQNPKKGWTAKKMLIEFAKYHVEQALKEASKKASIIDESIGGGLNIEVKSINKDSILNAYSLENIK